MSTTHKTQEFSAKIYKIGINRCVDVPKRVSDTFGKRGLVPVTGTIDGYRIRATLVPKGGGRHRLYVNGEMRNAIGADTSDRVSFVLRIDTRSREIPTPKDVASALRRVKGATATFNAFTPSKRRGILRWILDAKRPDTRERRIEKVIEHINEHSK
ncbi:MAG: DUF1905 domain-containing protein [Candidatus Latescibacterota bacterium]|nr:MAG: DUF1905 domain-containing protein [Candidatus Latescibacterota bacterium]